MTRRPRAAAAVAAAAVTGLIGAATPAQEPARDPPAAVPGLVLLVDTSRSLRPADVEQTIALLSSLLDRLPSTTPVGVLAFDDQARWLAPLGATPAEARNALAGLAPAGRHTLLHDALYTAGRALPAGGAVAVSTDGRDENSATTLEDVAGLFAARGVRLFALAAGPARDERALRRLALLTGSPELADVGQADPAALARAVVEALERSAADRARATPPASPTPTASAPAPDSASRERAPAGGSTGWILVALVGVALGAAAVAAAVLQRRRAQARVCSRCGTELPSGTTDCPHCREVELELELRAVPAASADEAIASFLPAGGPAPLTLEQRLERTFVLQEQPVLVIREAGEPPRSFLLPAERAFSVGREAGENTLAIPDPTLSARHFRVVPRTGEYNLLDLGSTNGTFLSGERVRAAHLRPGDRLRAGQVEFDFHFEQRRLGESPAPRQRARS